MSRSLVIAAADASVKVKLGMAAERGSLDLSECDLTEVPPGAFDIVNLEELSLAGNNLTDLPPDIGRLTALKRLQLSGNLFETLPAEIGQLTNLQGLWLHGNLLAQLPDSIGQLASLQSLSLSGNCLRELPATIGALSMLTSLEAAGNQLTVLPEDIGDLKALQKLAAFGNQLARLPNAIGGLEALRELWLQGNRLTALPASIGALQALEHLSVADNRVEELPPKCAGLTSLRTLSMYGNCLHVLPEPVLALPSLKELWVENNPIADSGRLRPSGADHHLALGPKLRNVGLDQFQTGRLPRGRLDDLADVLRPGEVSANDGWGYFKLKRAEQRDPGVSSESPGRPRLLVVAFGSAPGVPNWGSLLQRASDAMSNDDERSFDTLFVVDPTRSWYRGGEEEGYDYYKQRIAEFSSRYEKVLLLGDSMGGTAALLFSGLATAVHAFTPQVNLEESSIRPGKPLEWHRALKQRIASEVAAASAAGADVHIHVGNWLHDLRQARVIPKDHAILEIYDLDSHRLAYHLDVDNKLVPLIQRALKRELGHKIQQVRMANLL